MVAMLATHLFFLWSVRGGIARGDADFTVFYTAAKILRQGRGRSLYQSPTQREVQQEFTANSDLRRGPLPYIHPPFEALLFVPLAFLSYQDAFIFWNLLNVGLLVGIMLLLRGFVGFLQRISLPDLLLGTLAFFPIFANFHQGQDAILLLLLLVLAVRALDRHSDFLAGCWLGLAVFKYHLIIPLILLLVLWRGCKLLQGFAATASAMGLLSIAIVGWRGAAQYPAYVWRVMSAPGLGRIPYRQLPNLMGLLAGWPFLEDMGSPIQIAALACSVTLLIIVAKIGWSAKEGQTGRLSIGCAVISALLVGYSTNTYDLSLLVLPLALVSDYWLREVPGPAQARLSIILPAVPLLISPLWFFLWMRWERINLIAVFLLWWIAAIGEEIWRTRAGFTLQTVPALT